MIDRTGVLSVGEPMIPPAERLSALIAEALEARWLTNGGALHQRFEQAVTQVLDGLPCGLVSSGTMAVMMALRLGGLPEGSEIITPAISFAATAQAIAWCGFRPVFADVDPHSLTLCPRAAEAAMTERTAAILPVHLYGVPCDTDALADLAARHGLWLAYDAAQAFDIVLRGRSIAAFGDASAFSLHATKLLHSSEGGVIVLPNGRRGEIARMRNFGFRGGQTEGPGTNAKMSELHAAMGLAILPDLDREMDHRRALRRRYDAALSGVPGLKAAFRRDGASESLIYYSLRLPAPLQSRAREDLARIGVLARDAFPVLCGPGTAFPDSPIIAAGGEAPTAPLVAPEPLCLPLHGRVGPDDVDRIAAVIRDICGAGA